MRKQCRLTRHINIITITIAGKETLSMAEKDTEEHKPTENQQKRGRPKTILTPSTTASDNDDVSNTK
jgi:hypothetical protein